MYILILVSLLTICQPASSANSEILLRHNFGVAIVPRGDFNLGHSVWRHYFSFEFPNLTSILPLLPNLDCEQITHLPRSHCHRAAQIIALLNNERTSTAKVVNDQVKLIKKLIPVKLTQSVSSTSSKPRRFKRSFLPVVGSWLNSLFGVCDESHTTEMNKHMAALTELQKFTGKRLHSLSADFASYAETSDRHFMNKIDSIDDMAKLSTSISQVTNLQGQKLANITVSIELVFDLIENVISTDTSLKSIQNIAHSWLEGLHRLLDGYLPPPIITYDDMQNALYLVDAQLREMSQSRAFSVAMKSPAPYYFRQNVAFTQTDEKLIISVEIPIHRTSFDFKLYQFYAVPVRLNQTTAN